jgi:uncharacterized membrane protein
VAGIGFELRKILARDSYSATLRAYLYAGMISSGPWVLSILSVLIIGLMSIAVIEPNARVTQFLVSVTYLMSASLILTGGFQLMFTRFVSDRLFEKRADKILPNLIGVQTLVSVLAILIALPILTLFVDESFFYKWLMLANFLTLCNLWLVVIFLAGMKEYNRILLTMLCGYLCMIVAAYFLRHFHLEGLLWSLLLGHGVLLFVFMFFVLREFPSTRLLAFDFLDRRQVFISLFFTGLFYYLAVWADKYLFWFNPLTSENVIGPLNASLIYDIPIFLAYLAIIPGMAVFLVRIETDFSEHYQQLYDAVREGEALDHIYFLKDQMVYSIRQGILEVFKVQGVTVVLIFLWAPNILDWLGISRYYLPLFYVDLVGVSVQVVLMAVLNVYFYLNRRGIVLALNLLFFVANVALTVLSHQLGPSYYGYGFALSVTIAAFVGMVILNRTLDNLEYETFMLQK